MVQAQAKALLNQKNESSEALAQAAERLVAALDRLEDRLSHCQAPPPATEHESGQLALFAQENETLRNEQADLHETIRELQSQYDDLHKVAVTIYNKLEDSIKRLTRIMEQ